MSRADDQQVGGDHYKTLSITPWMAMAAWMSAPAFRGFLVGNAIKYLSRWEKKGGIEDLKKARHYLEKVIEDMERIESAPSEDSDDLPRCNDPSAPAGMRGWQSPVETVV